MKKLALVIPLGTLLVMALAYVITRWNRIEDPIDPIRPALAADIQPLDFPVRDGRIDGVVVAAAPAVAPEVPGGPPTPDGSATPPETSQKPLAGAVVWLRVGSELSFNESDANGAFHFTRVAHGPRAFGVIATGFDPQRFTLEDKDAAPRLVLTHPTDAPPGLPDMHRSDLRGRVTAPGVDLGGYQVCLAPRAPLEMLGAPIPVRTTCDATGLFSFAGLLEGEYTVQVLPRWAVDGSWPDLLRPASQATPQTFVHGANANPGGLALRSTAGALHGVLVDDAGAPLEAGLILVTPARDATRVWPPIASRADGSFSCLDLPPDRYALVVRAGGDMQQLEIAVNAGEDATVTFRPLNVARAK